MFEHIRSVQNPRVKNLVRLREGSHRRRQQRFLIEGFREITRARACGWPLETLFFCEELFKQEEAFDLLEACARAGLEVVQLGPEAFRKAAYREGPDGLLAVGVQQERSLDALPLSPCPLLVVLEAVEKPGNLGAIFRTAAAAGADALLLADPVTDPFNPNAIRASQGALFDLPFSCAGSPAVMAFLERHRIQPVLTSPAAPALLWEARLDQPVALVFGAEERGLSPAWLDRHPGYRLPMHGVSDSLNIASTVAVALFEAVRQRQPQACGR